MITSHLQHGKNIPARKDSLSFVGLQQQNQNILTPLYTVL